MRERIDSYVLEHNPQEAWNIFSNQVKHLETDLYIISNNEKRIGKIPNDIQKELSHLKSFIQYYLEKGAVL